MATSKLSSRQKMINMMYLVLIALLVLNVDRRVLKSFNTMEQNIMGSTEILNYKSESVLNRLHQIVVKDELKARPYYEKALEARVITKEFNGYIDELKIELEDLYGGRTEKEAGITLIPELKTPEQIEKHAHFFTVRKQGAKGKELYSKINETKDKLLNLLAPEEDSLFAGNLAFQAASNANQLNAEHDKGYKGWAQLMLAEQPAGAMMALLAQMQNNATALESDVITRLYDGVYFTDFKFDNIKAEVLPVSDYVMSGDAYKAQILLVASNSTTNPEIEVDGALLTDVSKGRGMLNIPTSGVGARNYKGVIRMLNPKTNAIDTYGFERKYRVYEPIATVSPSAMNLFYVGLNNPVSISVPGVTAEELNVSISSGGTIRSTGNGKYMVKVTGSAHRVSISVSAKGRHMGTTKFRVRNVPKPTVSCGALPNDGRGLRRRDVAVQTKMLASLGSDFAYDMRWRVTKYEWVYVHKNRPASTGTVTGDNISNELKQLLRNGRRGDMLIIQGVYAKDTEYSLTKRLSPLSINLL